MNRFLLCIYNFFFSFLFFLPVNAQGNKVIKVGKMVRESLELSWSKDTFLTYYIASDAKKIERFIQKGHWQLVGKRYTPYNDISRPKIRMCLVQTLSKVLTQAQKDSLNPQGDMHNLFMSQFYVFVKSKKRFVKLELTDDVDKFLTKKQIYKILRLYSKCKLPIHPVAGQLKDKEYYITGASVSMIE